MRQVLLLLALATLIRLPFLNQAIQGDDAYYLACAEHAQVEPLHPKHVTYVYQGNSVDMRGFPHPPLNDWFLAGVLALVGDIREVPFHAAYLLFSWIAVISMWSLARRFSARPMLATLMLIAVPTFVVNGTSLESDLPFLAFWLAAVALWVRAVDTRSFWWLSAVKVAMALAAFSAYQAVVLIPILGFYLWQRRRDWLMAWAVVPVPALVLLAWQVWERWTLGALPGAVVAGYFQTYNFQSLLNKATSAAALTGHLAWITGPLLVVRKISRAVLVVIVCAAAGGLLLDTNPLFWVSFALGAALLTQIVGSLRSQDADEQFLAGWIAIFFAAALVIFFTGSARYLLPLAAPSILLSANRFRDRPMLLGAGIALNLAVGLCLAIANYQQWDGYRRFVAAETQEFANRRVWINGEWGLRFYAETQGGLPIERGQAIEPGSIVITSKLAMPVEVTTGGGRLTRLAEQSITSSLPFRIIALGSRSGYSLATRTSLRPFDLSLAPIDVVRAELVVERKPVLTFVPMDAPEADSQIVSGVYQLEAGNTWRWAGGRAAVLVKRPPQPMPLVATFNFAGGAPGRAVKLTLDGAVVAEQRYESAGLYTLRSAPLMPSGDSAMVTIEVDKTFRVAGDQRELGFVLVGIGFQ